MERLTKRELADSMGKQIVLCNHKESDCNDSCMYGRCEWNKKALQKLKKYEDAEEQGLLLRLPCKVGDKVFYIVKNEISEFIITSFTSDTKEFYCNWKYNKGRYTTLLGFRSKEIGKTVFLTKEEAEQALAKMKEV